MGLNNIEDIDAFVRVVEKGSLSSASRDLNLSVAVVSKRLMRLESALGVRLIHRSTRQLSLTEDGREFFEHGRALLSQVQRAEAAIANRRDEVFGLLRITASNSFARRQLAPRLGRFLDRYPAVKIELVTTDDIVDIVKERIDIAIRQGELPDSTLYARSIATDKRVLCASPDYLNLHGSPASPDDLAQHRCIVFGDPPIQTWVLTQGETRIEVHVDWGLHVHAGDAAHAAVLGGAGIAFKSIWEIVDDFREGRLVEVLPGWSSFPRPIYAVYSSARYQTPRVRRFVDFLVSEMGKL
jgi:DNA-binding transcriptional LysR family regulator